MTRGLLAFLFRISPAPFAHTQEPDAALLDGARSIREKAPLIDAQNDLPRCRSRNTKAIWRAST